MAEPNPASHWALLLALVVFVFATAVLVDSPHRPTAPEIPMMWDDWVVCAVVGLIAFLLVFLYRNTYRRGILVGYGYARWPDDPHYRGAARFLRHLAGGLDPRPDPPVVDPPAIAPAAAEED